MAEDDCAEELANARAASSSSPSFIFESMAWRRASPSASSRSSRLIRLPVMMERSVVLCFSFMCFLPSFSLLRCFFFCSCFSFLARFSLFFLFSLFSLFSFFLFRLRRRSLLLLLLPLLCCRCRCCSCCLT